MPLTWSHIGTWTLRRHGVGSPVGLGAGAALIQRRKIWRRSTVGLDGGRRSNGGIRIEGRRGLARSHIAIGLGFIGLRLVGLEAGLGATTEISEERHDGDIERETAGQEELRREELKRQTKKRKKEGAREVIPDQPPDGFARATRGA